MDKINELMEAMTTKMQLVEDDDSERNAPSGSLKTIEEIAKLVPDEPSTSRGHVLEKKEQHEAKEVTQLQLNLNDLRKSLFDVFDFTKTFVHECEDCGKKKHRKRWDRTFDKPYRRPYRRVDIVRGRIPFPEAGLSKKSVGEILAATKPLSQIFKDMDKD